MKIQIKNRFNLSVIYECKADSLKIAVELAVKSRADLSGANLSGADLSGADLSGANLYGADLSGANLSGADLSGADLYGAKLSGANLSGANLYWADLYGAKLSGANLSGADLSGADLSGADLSGADLSGANLYGEVLDKNPIQVLGLKWFVLITKKYISIGCQRHEAEKWFKFKDDEISVMHQEALDWWKKNKKAIKLLWEGHNDK